MTTFDEDERSVSGSRPVDLYIIQTPTQTYRLTSGPVDVVFKTVGAGHNTDVNPGLGVTYTAITMSRGTQEVARDLTAREFMVYLPITHPLVQRYAAFGVPEQEVLIRQFRYQQVSDVAVAGWAGFVTTLTIDGSSPHVAVFRVPSVTDDSLKTRLPMIGAQVLCNHRLGDTQCQVDLDALKVVQVIASLSSDGLTMTTTATSGTAGYSNFGDIVHDASGQRRMCIGSAGVSVFVLSAPLIGAAPGDTVTLFPGCAHDVFTCSRKFSNVVNFGGHPDLNATINPWAPNGFGVVQQV